jgi:DNA processing protein
VVVSGLARGIDTAAHEASLATGTLAVMAGGVDVVYPPENAALHAAIAEQGAVVSEMLPGTPPNERLFPRRNRIISGLARALVVVVAAVRSCSLITARLAGEQGREVFAVPGSPLDPRAEGTNRLIRDGATLLMTAGDVLRALDSASSLPAAPRAPPASPGSPGLEDDGMTRLLELLSPAPASPDDIIRESGLAPGAVAALLLELTLSGRVVRHADGSVSLA